MESGLFAFWLACFISMLAITNPISTIGLFLSLTKNDKPAQKYKIAFRASLTAFCVLIFFALTGFLIFQIYGITIDAFRIAGGVILFTIGFHMLFPPHNAKHEAEYDQSQIYLVPIAIPMTSGPGAITTAIVLASQAKDMWMEAALWVAIFLACAINYLVLRYSQLIYMKAGKEGIAALIKIMGLLVCAVGVQFILTGLKAVFPILG